MINWISIIANGFWIFGLALILAGLSYYYWLADQFNRPLSQELTNTPFQRLVLFGLLLVGTGLVLTANGLLQTLTAAALILVCVIGLFTLFSRRHNQHPGG